MLSLCEQVLHSIHSIVFHQKYNRSARWGVLDGELLYTKILEGGNHVPYKFGIFLSTRHVSFTQLLQ